jgi:hypothetical protein
MARASFERGYGARLAGEQSFTTNIKTIAGMARSHKVTYAWTMALEYGAWL